MSYVGKYVCWGNDEGGFCFARIVGEVRSGPEDNPRESFLVEDRLSCNGEGRISHENRKTLVRKSVLNLDTDVIGFRAGLGSLTDEQLFLIALAGRVEGEVVQHKGIMNMLKAEHGEKLGGLAKEELESRMAGKVVKTS